MKNILVILEHLNGELKKQSKEALTAAKKTADSLNVEVNAVALGQDAGKAGDDAGKFGASTFYSIEDEKVKNYSPDLWASAVSSLIKKEDHSIVLASATTMGKDLLPHISAIFEKPTAQDVLKIDVESGKVQITRPMFAGKVWAVTEFTSDPQFITLRPNAVPAEEFGGSAAQQTFSEGLDGDAKSVVTEILTAASKKIDVSEADIIVSGGRGMGGPEKWPIIEELADLLGAANGASRAAVDAGWRPHAEQVGQTGKTVSPQLYIACGISGAIQHLAGMSSSKYIVAINKDPDAPIFKVADYGIVADLFDIVPKMIEEIKKSN